MTTPTIEELLARLDEQQARIDSLEAAASVAAGNQEQAGPARRPARITRRGVVKSAAVGAAGLMGGFLLEPGGVASAATTDAAGPSSFTSSTATPAVTATNTGTGTAVTATAKAGVSVQGNQSGTGSSVIGVQGSITGANGTGTGVVGTSPKGHGVRGTSSNGTGVYGTSGSKAANAAAIEGVITSTSPGALSAGVLGTNNATNGEGAGVAGTHTKGYGVYGQATSGTGVAGISESGIGILAEGNGDQAGLYAYSANWIAVQAEASTADAVSGVSNSADGVFGYSASSNGVEGEGDGGYGVYGSSSNHGIVGTSVNGNGLYGYIATAPQAGVVGQTTDASGNWGVFSYGNLGASGTKSAVVPARDGRGHVALYCLESPECWFEDFGSARLSGGKATVGLDPEFAHTVDLAEYHVFLQAEGDCGALFVSGKTATGFEVREQGGGRGDAPFAYRIVARRKDVDAPRLNRVTLPDDTVRLQPRRRPARIGRLSRPH